MPTVVLTKLISGREGGFRSEEHEVTETKKQYQFSHGNRSVLSKGAMMKPDSIIRAEAMPVAASIWHLPEQEADAKALLVSFCRERVKEARSMAAKINAAADAGEALLNSLGV